MSEGAGMPEAVGAEERVRASFEKQGLMRLLGAEVVEVGEGEGRCVIEVPFREDLTQQERACANLLQTVSLSPSRP